MAAVEALEAAGCHVTLPPKGLCCGRPLYDFGMIDRAKRYLLEVLDALRDDLRAGVRVVGIEPSCLAVFRDELRSLLPRDEDAARLVGQAVRFAELLEQTEGWEPPRLERKAIFHGHCHQRATGGIEPEVRILERMGVEVELPQSGCWGLAGSFGFTAEHYELSIASGERVLPPRRA